MNHNTYFPHMGTLPLKWPVGRQLFYWFFLNYVLYNAKVLTKNM